MVIITVNRTQIFLSLSCRVVLGLTAAAGLFVFLHQHPLQAGPEQSPHTNCLLSSGAVDDDGVQTPKTITLQQWHQSLQRRGHRRHRRENKKSACESKRDEHASLPTWSFSLSMDTDSCRLEGTAADRTAMPSWSLMSRCCAMSSAVDSVAVAVSPSKQRTPKRSLSTYKHTRLCITSWTSPRSTGHAR